MSAIGEIIRKGTMVALLPLLLAACQSSKMAEGEVSEGERRFTERLLFGGNKLPDPKPFNQREFTCPQVELQDGTAALRVGGDSARGASYQVGIHDVARECVTEGGVQRVKLGVRGRVVIGAGNGGNIGVPLRIVVREGEKIISSRLVSTSVSAAAQGSETFSVIDEGIRLTVSDQDPGEQYTIVVGLDSQGTRAARPAKRRRR